MVMLFMANGEVYRGARPQILGAMLEKQHAQLGSVQLRPMAGAPGRGCCSMAHCLMQQTRCQAHRQAAPASSAAVPSTEPAWAAVEEKLLQGSGCAGCWALLPAASPLVGALLMLRDASVPDSVAAAAACAAMPLDDWSAASSRVCASAAGPSGRSASGSWAPARSSTPSASHCSHRRDTYSGRARKCVSMSSYGTRNKPAAAVKHGRPLGTRSGALPSNHWRTHAMYTSATLQQLKAIWLVTVCYWAWLPAGAVCSAVRPSALSANTWARPPPQQLQRCGTCK